MNQLIKTTAIAIIMGCTSAQPLLAQDPLHIDNDGNVGIGTNKPDSKLNVAGDVHATTSLRADGQNILFSGGKEDNSSNVVLRKNSSGAYIYPFGVDGASNTLNVGWAGGADPNGYTNLRVAGNTSLSKDLTVGGNTTLSKDLTVTGNTTIPNSLSCGPLNAGLAYFYSETDPGPRGNGLSIRWNRQNGGGRTDLINYKGLGVGGFVFWNEDPNGNISGPLMTIDGNGGLTVPGVLNVGGTTSINGHVGIGTPSPQAPLEVAGINCNSQTYNNLPDNNNCTGQRSNSFGHVSILAHGDVIAWGYHDHSDARIKKDIRSIQLHDNLSLINKLRVVDYRYKDSIEHGNITKRGFIAQEVETVFPQAIKRISDFIPDIFMLSEKVVVKGTQLIVTLKNRHNLSTGDTVRLIPESSVKELPVTVIDEKTFYVDAWDQPLVKSLFVYGKKVNDYRAVDYDQIFSASVGAMQELSKKVAVLEAENEMLKKQDVANRKTMATSSDEMADILSRVSKLEASSKTAKK